MKGAQEPFRSWSSFGFFWRDQCSEHYCTIDEQQIMCLTRMKMTLICFAFASPMRQKEIKLRLFLLTGLNYCSIRRKFSFNSKNILINKAQRVIPVHHTPSFFFLHHPFYSPIVSDMSHSLEYGDVFLHVRVDGQITLYSHEVWRLSTAAGC